MIDLMWSDPDEVPTWAVSPRGAGWLFGAKVTAEVGPRLCLTNSQSSRASRSSYSFLARILATASERGDLLPRYAPFALPGADFPSSTTSTPCPSSPEHIN
jgi:hypothetical protein